MDEEKLSVRQRNILRVLIQEHIASATPVGSGTIQKLGQLGVSSATIRNDLAALEELGYVTQPHTSAGRVPTVTGYRYFVEQLMEQVDLPVPEKRMIRHQFHQVRLELDQWMRLTATVLAQASQAAALVTPPHATTSRFRHMELISINDALCLMVLVLQDGSMHQEMLGTALPIDQDALSRASNRINALLRDRTAREIQASSHPDLAGLRGWRAQVLERIIYLMEQVDRQSILEIYRDGLVNVLREPEFVESTRVRQIVEILEHRGFLESVLAKTLNATGVQIIIGGEGTYEEIDEVSLVLSPYGVKGKASGVLGVMGPRRMSYARAISAIRYVGHLMDGMVSEVYGIE